MGSLFRVLFYQPTFNLLIILYQFFASNLGWAIVAVAALSRLVTYPLTKSQIKSAERGRELQGKYDKLKKKYGKNKEKLNEEMMKLQAQYLPSQLGGCLPIIILIIMLIQVRAGIVHLVDKGWYAFNEVAYSEELKREEDHIKYTPQEDLETGEHRLVIELETNEGNKISKEYVFEVVNNDEEKLTRQKELEEEEKSKDKDTRDRELSERNDKLRDERKTDISIFSEKMEENRVQITISKFLVFVTNSKSAYIFTEKRPAFDFYMRPPSNQIFIDGGTHILLDDVDISSDCDINQGESLNLNFLGIDLSKVAADFSFSDKEIIPYIILALMVGISQFATSQILSGFRAADKPKDKKDEKKKKKKKKAEEEMPDMSEMMQMTSKQMMFMFPALTIITSMGYWGGSSIFPAGLSIFWTVQSLFVIIQQSVMNREKVIKWFNLKFKREEKSS